MSCACGARLAGLPNARRTRWRTAGQAKRELPARRSLEGNDRALEAHQIASLIECPLLTQSGHRTQLRALRLRAREHELHQFGPARGK